MMNWNFARILIGLLNVPSIWAQTPKFEVASIKPSNSEDRRPLYNFQNSGQSTAKNATVKKLIQVAYGIKDFQISGGPSWIGSDFYDLSAKPEAPGTGEASSY